MGEKAILTIAVPIYNRSIYLERMLNNFLCDKELFYEKVFLHISDNCSSENLNWIIEKYKEKGLNVHYHRNETNIGGDNNIILCYQLTISKYILVLGSDDIPKPGIVRRLVNILDSNDFGVLHLNHHNIKEEGLRTYNNHEKFLEDINIWMTFISSNVVNCEYVKSFNFDRYRFTNFSQVALYILASSKKEINAIYSCGFLEGDDDSAANGGYNLFQVFITNLLEILKEAVHMNYISNKCYRKIKKYNFQNLLAGEVARKMILRKKTNMDLNSAWTIVFHNYGYCLYSYVSVCKELFKTLRRKVFKN